MRRLLVIPAILAFLVSLAIPAFASDPVAAIRTGAFSVSNWPTDWQQGNAAIGPLQTDRIFYPDSLPASYNGSQCSMLPADVTCIISYKTPDANVASYVSSIPADRKVIMIFHHEPERPGIDPAWFVSTFERQSSEIRHAAGCFNCHVQVAEASEAWGYFPGRVGASCAYTVPDKYVDYYFIDIYQPAPDGKPLSESPVAPQWDGWLKCVTAANNADPHPRKALGITEYGLGTLSGNAVREETLAADDAYLKANFTHFALWEYWWADNSVNGGCTPSNCDWRFTDPATIHEWQQIEAGN
jgi:hypothetical protein